MHRTFTEWLTKGGLKPTATLCLLLECEIIRELNESGDSVFYLGSDDPSDRWRIAGPCSSRRGLELAAEAILKVWFKTADDVTKAN